MGTLLLRMRNWMYLLLRSMTHWLLKMMISQAKKMMTRMMFSEMTLFLFARQTKYMGDSAEDTTFASATSDSQTNPASGSSSRAAAVRGSDSVDHRSSNSYGSKGAMSFAAAAMTGLGSGNRGIRGGRDRQGRPLFGGSSDLPKLTFTSGGKQLNRHLTIYQDIQRQLVLDEDDDERYAGSDLMQVMVAGCGVMICYLV